MRTAKQTAKQKDQNAINEIAEILNSQEWTSDTLEAVAIIVGMRRRVSEPSVNYEEVPDTEVPDTDDCPDYEEVIDYEKTNFANLSDWITNICRNLIGKRSAWFTLGTRSFPIPTAKLKSPPSLDKVGLAF